MRDSLDVLEALYMMPDGLKGIQRSADNLNARLYSASRYIAEVEGAASQMALLELARAKEQVAKVLLAVNNFLTTTFADYRKQVEAVPLQLFKNLEAVEIPE